MNKWGPGSGIVTYFQTLLFGNPESTSLACFICISINVHSLSYPKASIHIDKYDCKAHNPLKTPLRWIPNANEINTENMKCTWPTPAPPVGEPMPPIFHLLTLGVGVGGNANFSILCWG